jgi:hypothetical protein
MELERRARTTDGLARLNARFEGWIRATPEQWVWHQRRWRTQPTGARPEALPTRPGRARTFPGVSLQSADQGLAVD